MGDLPGRFGGLGREQRSPSWTTSTSSPTSSCRGSWGETGNEAIGDFQYLGLYGTSNYGDIPGTAPSNLPNPDLKWETTREWNVGIDASFLSDRLGIVAEVYNKADGRPPPEPARSPAPAGSPRCWPTWDPSRTRVGSSLSGP